MMKTPLNDKASLRYKVCVKCLRPTDRTTGAAHVCKDEDAKPTRPAWTPQKRTTRARR